MNLFQRGNTVLGFIIGVVVGLAAALAVAVYVTKVPVPFVNKGQTRGPEQDAAEAQKNKNWDPNAPLYGKNAVKPAPAASGVVTAPAAVPVPTVAAAKPAASAPAAVAVAAAKPEAKPVAAASTDPLGDLAKARLGASVDPFTYFVQVGAYRTPEDAEAQRAKLAMSGIEAKVSEREQSGRTVYRVRTGPYDSKDEADKAKEKLDAAGLETALIRVSR
jgi:cell division protein FtsN